MLYNINCAISPRVSYTKDRTYTWEHLKSWGQSRVHWEHAGWDPLLLRGWRTHLHLSSCFQCDPSWGLSWAPQSQSVLRRRHGGPGHTHPGDSTLGGSITQQAQLMGKSSVLSECSLFHSWTGWFLFWPGALPSLKVHSCLHPTPKVKNILWKENTLLSSERSPQLSKPICTHSLKQGIAGAICSKIPAAPLRRISTHNLPWLWCVCVLWYLFGCAGS